MFRHGLNVLAVVAALVGSGAAPAHPDVLNEKLQHYVAARVHEFDKIPEQRRADLRKLATYLRDKQMAHQPARLTFICTHNSRRSQICQIWAATAAAYYGRSGVEVYSGGTEVTSFNARAVAALRRAGFVIDEPKTTQNPRFRVRFCAAGPELECFSKFYRDASNPQADFCAVMTCSQADKQCPIVQGAAQRLSVPFDDPKVFDNTAQESRKYDERCEQIARELLFVFSCVDH
ncbi:MAG TPA: protein-tyrosine-phosphatase [Planctomycetaceae bacterium]|jgi:protein-tyrosine-phosphatase|nr:protein-tyrosine-phosphatase [Planctomycetaceae bacterium]